MQDKRTSQGRFRYVKKDADLTVNPNLYHLPPLSAFNDLKTLPVTDIRSSLALEDDSSYKLEYHGFTARRHLSRLHSAPYDSASWNDPELIKAVYVPEVEELVTKVTGCRKALVESAVIRNNVHTEVDSLAIDSSGPDCIADDMEPCPRMIGFSEAGGASPAPKVHLDFSPIGARTHIRKYHRNLALAAEPVIEAENKLLKSGVKWDELKDHYRESNKEDNGVPRFALFSVWRPLKTVYRDPLAVASCASFPTSDYVPVDIVQPSGRQIPHRLSQIIDPDNPDAGTAEKHTTKDHRTHLSESYLAHEPVDSFGEGHNWHFISNQEPEHVLIIQLFDNQMEAQGVRLPSGNITGTQKDIPVSGVMHSAFELEDQDYTGEARESLEVRVAAFWQN